VGVLDRSMKCVPFRPLLRLLLVASTRVVVVDAVDASFDQPFASAAIPHVPCVTLYHRNGRQGCGTADHDLQTGTLRYFQSGSSAPNVQEEYVAVVEDYVLTSTTLQTLMTAYRANGLLQGILVVNSTSIDENDNSFRSPDSQYPQGYGTPSAGLNYGNTQYAWNARGEDLLGLDLYGIPMVYVADADLSVAIVAKAKDPSAHDSSIVAAFNYYMGPDNITSVECLRWKDTKTNRWNPKCLPLGGTSVWATAGSPPPSDNTNNRPVVLVGAGMDSTTLFHETTPAANAAAANIVVMLLAAKLLGENVDDAALDALPNRIGFALFEGETYGFMGSRNFLRDVAYPGFQCNDAIVPSVSKNANGHDYACLSPLRPSLKFTGISSIAGMIAVDQVAYAVGQGLLYTHADQNQDTYGAFLANVLKACSTSAVTVAPTSATASNGNYPYPPSPLTSLLSLSQGAVGGAVLSGYDYAFTNAAPYHSVLDDARLHAPDYQSIAGAATIVARSALAAAYDDGTYNSAAAATYAANIIPELESTDETLVTLADCVFYNSGCRTFREYAQTEFSNEKSRTGLDLRAPTTTASGTTPNYYVGVYNDANGQPFVRVGDRTYGAYNGKEYGNGGSDAFGILPREKARAIRGLLNDYLGRGSVSESIGETVQVQKCTKLADCASVKYCSTNSDSAICTAGGVCVCLRAHYHVAMDEALLAAENEFPGRFVVDETNDQGVSPMYTEPYWSNSVGVKVYRDVGQLPGLVTLVLGIGMAVLSFFAAFVLKVGLKKEKLY
jgi:nicastrin